MLSQFVTVATTLANFESNITNQLLSVNTTLSNVESNITNQILSLNTFVSNINSSLFSQILTSAIDVTNNITGNLTAQLIDVSATVTNINSSISDLVLNVSIDVNSLGSNITNMYSQMNISFGSVGDNFTYLDLNLYGNFTLMNGTLNNVFDMFDNSPFPEDFNYTASLDEQKQIVSIVNQLSEDTAIIELKNTLTDTVRELRIGAETSRDTIFSTDGNYQYRIKSVESGEYLEEWTRIDNDTSNISIGWYTAPPPAWDREAATDPADLALVFILFIICLVLVVWGFIRVKRKLKKGDGRDLGGIRPSSRGRKS
jgi:hypothetical protein